MSRSSSTEEVACAAWEGGRARPPLAGCPSHSRRRLAVVAWRWVLALFEVRSGKAESFDLLLNCLHVSWWRSHLLQVLLILSIPVAWEARCALPCSASTHPLPQLLDAGEILPCPKINAINKLSYSTEYQQSQGNLNASTMSGGLAWPVPLCFSTFD